MKKSIRSNILIAGLLCLLLLLSGLSACAPAAPDEAPVQPSSQTSSDPEDVSEDAEPESAASLTCSMTIRCDTILRHMDELTKGKEGLIPADGLLFEEEEIPFEEGESVFDVLQRELQKRRLHLEFSENPLYGSVYVEGIFNLYELDCGELSGWIYRVNGETAGYGCSRYILSDGDRIEWLYTCDLGNDL